MTQSLRLLAAMLVVFAGSLALAQDGKPQTSAGQEQKSKPRPSVKTATTPAKLAKFFPYQIHERKLANGLPVIIIPTPEFKDMVTYSTPVFAGSRNETQKGKTGLAHLFEHVMFLHQYGGVKNGYEEHVREMGAHNNAFTSYDITFYHPTTFTSNLIGPVMRGEKQVPGLVELESARFKNLSVDRKTFEVEAGAVLGEYRRIFSDPTEKMVEMLSPLAFPTHPYGHTVIGYYDDVVNMPNAWDAAWEFYRGYYQPNNVALVIVGDVDPAKLMPEIEKRYSDWKPVPVPKIAPEKEPSKEVSVHVPWDAEVSPHVMVGYHTPAMVPGTKDGAVTQILSELLVSRSAPLFQKLRYQKQTVTNIGFALPVESSDPGLLLLDTELLLEKFKTDGTAYPNDVKADLISGIEELKTFSKTPKAATTLEVVKSKVRNDFLHALDSTGSIAEAFATTYRYTRDVNTIDKMMAAIDSLTPTDIDNYAKKNFTDQRRVIATMWYGETKSETAEVK
ncbi:MAG TPA: pitrilysin family protein [Terriglobales bacterium]|nr:pitrilysin family protein [Terriglobales bacterium]